MRTNSTIPINFENYSKKKLAEANTLLFNNTGYVHLEMAKSLSTNTKFFFSGEGSPLGSVFAKIMGETKTKQIE